MTQIAPVGCQRDHGGPVRLFHHRVVDGVGGRTQEGVGVGTDKVLIGVVPFPRRLARRMNAGSVQGQLFKVDGCAEQEHAAVPQIPSVRQHGLGSGEIRFFHKARHSIPARGQRPTPADIPEPCFRCIRRDAECNDTPGLGAGAGPRHGFGENILRFQHMIGRQHQQQRIPPPDNAANAASAMAGAVFRPLGSNRIVPDTPFCCKAAAT